MCGPPFRGAYFTHDIDLVLNPSLVAEHRAHLEDEAQRHRATRSLRRIWRRK